MGQDVQDPSTPPVGGLEREVFGKWTLLLRNFVGTLSVITLCVVSLLNAYTIHVSVSEGKDWPGDITLLILYVGNILVAWSWVNTNKTLSILLGNESVTNKLRGKIATVIAPPERKDE